MARYRKIDTRIWNDHKFNSLSDDAKLVFMLLLTHQHLTPIGAMRTTISGLASEMHWEINRFKAAFDEIIKLNMARFDEASSFLWLPNFLKFNRPESPNVVRSWEDLLDYLPECSLLDEMVARVAGMISTMHEAFVEALPHVFRKTMPNQEQEQEQKQEQEQERERVVVAGFSPAIFQKNSSLSKKNLCIQKNWNEIYKNDANEVINFLNEYANKAYEPTYEHLYHIIERMKEGVEVDVFRSVIVRKTNQWKGKDSMEANLNPVTLFKRENFNRYKGELVLPKGEASDEAR